MSRRRSAGRAGWPLAGAALTACLGTAALADGFNAESFRPSVVLVVARGVSPAQGNAPRVVQGTGFITSRDGYIATSRHLISKLGDIDPRTLSFEIHFRASGAPDFVPAQQMFENIPGDVLVLYANLDGRTVASLPYTDRNGVALAKTPVYAIGYPAGYQFMADVGVMKSWALQEAIPAWASSLGFREGQSGSPIVLENGRVLALAKGTDEDAPTIGLVTPARLIPPEYWDAGWGPGSSPAPKQPDPGDKGLQTQIIVEAPPVLPTRRQRTLAVQAEPCQGFSVATRRIDATPGWSIDPASIALDMRVSEGKGNSIRTLDARPEGFQLLFQLQNEGSCAEGQTDIPARVISEVRYAERPSAGTPVLAPVTTVRPIDGARAALPLNVKLSAMRFLIQDKDGRTEAFVPRPEELLKSGDRLMLDAGRARNRLLQGP